jgi:hypothetical protein
VIAEQTSCTFVIEQDCEIQYSNYTTTGAVSRTQMHKVKFLQIPDNALENGFNYEIQLSWFDYKTKSHIVLINGTIVLS